jgi:hypothetical protein
VTDEAPDIIAGPVLADCKPAEEEPPLTVKQIARESGMSPQSIYELCLQRLLKHIRIGKAIRIRREWWEEYKRANTVEPLPGPNSAA